MIPLFSWCPFELLGTNPRKAPALFHGHQSSLLCGCFPLPRSFCCSCCSGKRARSAFQAGMIWNDLSRKSENSTPKEELLLLCSCPSPLGDSWEMSLGKEHRILPEVRLMHEQICTLSCITGLLTESFSWRCSETVLPWQHYFHSFGNAQWLPSWNCAWAVLGMLFSLPGMPLPVTAVFSTACQEIFENHWAYRNSDL